ncbi:hypothetical protein [Tenggerimyces flavus]|uniref:Uncharacterized protein n=1 Tax=Tenggerimyces flavus TaxID=1708749 RepID=A0ABV7YJT7_9ACTN|nr:hypothetical protein [Tenggerimyces flavus]MBM7784869.1 hypothetical protein [Tenggerimyces flavus]
MGTELVVRDAAVMAAIFGFAAMMWLGWAQEAPPRTWRFWLGAGAVLGALLAIGGGLLAWQNWSPESALAAESARRTFGIVAGIEFGLAGIGAALLGLTKRAQWINPWIALVVGLHFIPLAHLFNDLWLYGLAAIMVAGAGAAVWQHRRTGTMPSAVSGLVSGVGLLAYAIRDVILVLAA